MKYRAVTKAGRLANGFESDRGRVVHAVHVDRPNRSLCGTSPAISWSERDVKEISCNKCLIKIEQSIKEKK